MDNNNQSSFKFQELTIELQERILKELVYKQRRSEIDKFKDKYEEYCKNKKIKRLDISEEFEDIEDEELFNIRNLIDDYAINYVEKIGEDRQEKIIKESKNIVKHMLGVNELIMTKDEYRKEINDKDYEKYYRKELVIYILMESIGFL